MRNKLAAGLAAGALGIALVGNVNNAVISHRQCVQTQRLNRYVYNAALRSEKTLPTIAYYKHHQKELRDVLAQIREQENFFKPADCPVWRWS